MDPVLDEQVVTPPPPSVGCCILHMFPSAAELISREADASCFYWYGIVRRVFLLVVGEQLQLSVE